MSPKPTISRENLRHLLGQLDAFDAIGAMLFATYAGFPSRARERLMVSSGVATEYVVMHLLRRGTVAPAAPPPAEPALVDELVMSALAGVNTEAFTPGYGSDGDPTGMETNAHIRFLSQQLVIYDPVVPELEAERWPALFAPEEAALERVTGLDIAAIGRITGALLHRTAAWCLVQAGIPYSELDGTNYFSLLKTVAIEGRGRRVLPGSGAELATTPEELASEAEVPLEQVHRFIDLFATRPGAAADAPFTRFVWELRRRPLIAWDERIILPVPLDLTMALRPTLETALRAGDAEAGARYDQHKGKWVEHRALELLDEILKPAQAYRTVEEQAAPSLTDPEHDGLLRVDHVALAVEVKGGGVAPAARRGNADSQDKVFRRLIHDAIDQADNIIKALQTGVPVTGVDLASDQRWPVDLGPIDRWIPLVVTLEDMSGVVAAPRALFGDRPRDLPHPVVLTIDDIAWIGGELALPAQFIHYFVVRERIARSPSRLVMYDEIEWFALYYASGGAWFRTLLEGFGKIDSTVLVGGGGGRRGALSPELVPWRTPFAAALERWQADGEDGWLTASMAMLDLSTEQNRGLVAELAPMRRRAIKARDAMLITLIPAGDPSVALQVIAPGNPKGTDIADYTRLFLEGAPDADRHVFLLVTGDEPGELQLAGVLPVQPVLPEDAASS